MFSAKLELRKVQGVAALSTVITAPKRFGFSLPTPAELTASNTSRLLMLAGPTRLASLSWPPTMASSRFPRALACFCASQQAPKTRTLLDDSIVVCVQRQSNHSGPGQDGTQNFAPFRRPRAIQRAKRVDSSSRLKIKEESNTYSPLFAFFTLRPSMQHRFTVFRFSSPRSFSNPRELKHLPKHVFVDQNGRPIALYSLCSRRPSRHPGGSAS